MPRALLLLPLFTGAGEVCGGLYVMSFVKGNLVSIQQEVEALLLVASETIASCMTTRAPLAILACLLAQCELRNTGRKCSTKMKPA